MHISRSPLVPAAAIAILLASATANADNHALDDKTSKALDAAIADGLALLTQRGIVVKEDEQSFAAAAHERRAQQQTEETFHRGAARFGPGLRRRY